MHAHIYVDKQNLHNKSQSQQFRTANAVLSTFNSKLKEYEQTRKSDKLINTPKIYQNFFQ